MVLSPKYSLTEFPLARGAAGFLLPGGTLSKGGRHRKERARFANGHLKQIREDIIPEGIAMRRMAILELSGAERDMRAESPLGVIRARGLILDTEYQAGERWERQHRRMDERARTPPGCLGNLLPSGEGSIAIPTDAAENAGEERDYLASRAALKAAGSRAFHITQNIVIHHHWPRLLDTERRRPEAAWTADARDLSSLRAGLEALARVMKLRGEKGDNFSDLIFGLERKLDRQPSEIEVAEALMQFGSTSLLMRREARLKREAPQREARLGREAAAREANSRAQALQRAARLARDADASK